MQIREILKCLPHRYPFLLVDRVLSCEPGKNILALKNVAINEPFFQGHFPEIPIMPGVLILEALAQAAAILSHETVKHDRNRKWLYYFVGIDNARFKRPVTPGDQLILDVTMGRNVRGIGKFSAQARVGDVVVSEADLMCTMREE
ncbi:MAG TPA: 3-hydroxyacyl-ACP dehydratase FabZ [Burkholderiales bacterium]|nr:3-hydroxyacyl-ACP dehydratase FabZ [Burkholderiales bacterium]